MRIPFTSPLPLAQGIRLATVGLALALMLAGCGGGETSDAGSDAAGDQASLDDTGDAEGTALRGGLSTAPSLPPPPPPPPEAPPQPLPGTDAVIVAQQSGPTSASPDFDSRAFAGTYSGGTTRLDIGAEGQFALDESGQTTAGTWTLQAGGKTIVLDPDAKGDTDRLLQLEPDGSVRIAGGATLRRQ